MICRTLNKLISKNKSYCLMTLLFTHACWLTMYTEVKIIGKGYRRNLFSVSNLNCTNMGEKS
jgi:hypothetical protein